MIFLDSNRSRYAVNREQNLSWRDGCKEGFCEEILPGQKRRTEQAKGQKEGVRRYQRTPFFCPSRRTIIRRVCRGGQPSTQWPGG